MASDTGGAQAHHWEVSWAPLVAVLGIFFLVPLGFSAHFVYESTLLTSIFAGIGVPLLLLGLAKWMDEGLTHVNLVPGVGLIGISIFIVSEVFIFLSLFSSYWMMRLKLDVWPPEGTPELNLSLPIVMTVLLVASSVTIHHAETKLEHGDKGGFKTWLMITILLGAVFLGCTIYEYSHLIHEGFVPSSNAFSSAFFSITGFHASHVLLGLCAFVACLLPVMMSGRTNETYVKSVSVYWHFVDIIWFFVVSQVYYW